MTGTARRDAVVIAVDLGGTSIKAGILGSGGLYELRRIATERQRGPQAVISTVISAMADLLDRCDELGLDAVAAGLAVPGIVDGAGVGRYSVTMGWRDLAIREQVAAAVPCPVAVGHDVRSGAVAEATFGAAVDEPTALFVPIGTGISAALVVAGAIVEGATFQAGELGQLLVPAAVVGAPAGGGSSVTLEATSSARSIVERFARAASVAPDSVDAGDVVAAAAAGDVIARAVWDEAIERLARVLAAAIAIVDPAVVVLGGGLSRAGAALSDPLAVAVADMLPWRQPPRLAIADFADDAGFVGAAIGAWQRAAGRDPAALAGVLGKKTWRQVAMNDG